MSRSIPFIKIADLPKVPTVNPAALKTTNPMDQPISQETKIILIDFFKVHQNLVSEMIERLKVINSISPSMSGNIPNITEYLSSFKTKLENPEAKITKGNVTQLINIINLISNSVGQYAKTFPQIADKLRISIK